jgi:formylglycine-generating enzyme required for sulfatase activity
MAARQAWAGWAAVLAAALLAAPGCSSQAEPPKELTLDLGGGVAMKLVLIPAGKFTMGEEGDLHEVTLSKPFYMGVTEVTQAQYQAIMGENPSDFKGETNPVETVAWNEATEFCKKVSEKTRQEVRLPTEAEWEYACRAGSKTRFCFGDAREGLGDYAWYNANSGNTTHPVGQKKPNAWGLYDMHGNVFEWCSDWYGEYAAGPAADPTGPATGSDRVLRGGCWFSNPLPCRSAGRLASGQGHRHTINGFGLRVVAPVGPGLQ